MLSVARAIEKFARTYPLTAFYPKMSKVFPCFIECYRTVRKVFFEIIAEEQVYTTDSGPVAALTLKSKLEHQRLHRFAEICCGVHGNILRIFSDFLVMHALLAVTFEYKFVQQFHISRVPMLKRVESLQAGFEEIDFFRVCNIPS